MNLDDLPDDLLVQVLDKLPCDFVSRSKCVSKRWFILISNSACLTQKRCTTLFFFAQGFPNFDKRRRLELFTMSERWGFREFPSVVLLPPSYFNQVVLATHNDFLLCKASNRQHQYNYYIYNPLTLEGFSVPPPPRWDDRKAPEPKAVGFLYFPNEHKWMVVRMFFGSTQSRNKIKIEIFSSKSGEWKEDAILSYKAKYKRLDPVSVAYNGVLYWTGFDRCGHRYIFRLDGYSYHFILIDTVKEYSDEMCCLGVCQGRLRMVQMLVCNGYKEQLIFRIWELKEGKMGDGDGDEYKWCLIGTVVLDAFIVDDPPIPLWDGAEIKLLALDPNHEEIVYLNVDMHVVTCNFGTRTVRIVKDNWKTNGNVSDYETITAFPFAFSHLPTPTAPHHPWYAERPPPVDVSRRRPPQSNSWKQWPAKRFNGHCYRCGRYGHRIADCDIAGSRNKETGARNSWRRQLEQEW